MAKEMAKELKITAEYKGYTISWLSFQQEYAVERDGQQERRNFVSPTKAQEWIDAQTKKIFKRVDVLIQVGWGVGRSFVSATATSVDEDGRKAWVSERDGKRGKWEIGDIYLSTPENLAIVEKLKGLKEQLRIIEKDKDNLMAGMAKLTPEMMEAKEEAGK